MTTLRLHELMIARKYRWPVVLVLAVCTGIFPFADVSNAVEFCAIVAVPFLLGFLISRWWDGLWNQLPLAIGLPLFGAVIRLASTSLHDGANWFGRVYRVMGVAFTDPYARQIFITLLFPACVTTVVGITFIALQRRGGRV